VENTHEPIADAETFERARQARLNNAIKYNAFNRHGRAGSSLFKGLIFCAECGSVMQRRRYVGKRINEFRDRIYCPAQRKLKTDCTVKSVLEKDLYDAALRSIKGQIAAAADMAAIVERLNKQRAADRASLSERISWSQREIKRLTSLKASLYESYADKLLTEDDYIYSKQQYDQRLDEIKGELERLQDESVAQSETLTPKNKWLAVFQRFADHDELSREMVVTLIKKVIVKGSGEFEFVWHFKDEYDALCGYTLRYGSPVSSPTAQPGRAEE